MTNFEAFDEIRNMYIKDNRFKWNGATGISFNLKSGLAIFNAELLESGEVRARTGATSVISGDQTIPIQSLSEEIELWYLRNLNTPQTGT